MNYNPNERDAMDDVQVSGEIADFMKQNFGPAGPQPVEEPIFEELPFNAPASAEPAADAGFSAEPIFEELPLMEEPLPQPAEKPAPRKKEANPHAPRKRRPKRRKEYRLFGLPQILATVVWLTLVVFIGVTAGRFLWICAADVLAFGRPDAEVSVTVTAEDDMESIIKKLSDSKLIHYPWLFRLYADLSNAQDDIVPGTFTLNTNYDYHALVNEMSSSASKREEVRVQIPEGYSCRQIFQLLEEKGVATVAELEEYAAIGELDDYWFLDGVERGDKYCLEGFLFPDTYNFYTSGGPAHALRKLLNGFESQFNKDLQAQIEVLNAQLAEKMRANGESEEYVISHMFTVREVVIVASLIEKEAANVSEGPNIASVIYNRLFSWGNTPRYLNIDAALVYALDGKTELTGADTEIDHPYNTYKNTGLTPGPIANPGLASLKAALEPANTSYFYYVLNPETGEHTFSKTYDQHQAAGG